MYARDIVSKADLAADERRPRKCPNVLGWNFISYQALWTLFPRRLESSISDHNSRTRVEVEEVSLYRWNKDGKFFGKHLLSRVSATSLSGLFPAGQTD